jgi:hypothetical protein
MAAPRSYQQGAISAPSPHDDDPALDTRAAADYLGLKAGTLEVWRSTGRYDLAFEKRGRCVRYRKSVLDRFLASRTYTSTGGYETSR